MPLYRNNLPSRRWIPTRWNSCIHRQLLIPRIDSLTRFRSISILSAHVWFYRNTLASSKFPRVNVHNTKYFCWNISKGKIVLKFAIVKNICERGDIKKSLESPSMTLQGCQFIYLFIYLSRFAYFHVVVRSTSSNAIPIKLTILRQKHGMLIYKRSEKSFLFPGNTNIRQSQSTPIASVLAPTREIVPWIALRVTRASIEIDIHLSRAV